VYMPVAGAGAASGARPAIDGGSGGLTVLLVEDLRRVRELARKVLVHDGYRVLTAASAREALDVARGCEGKIDLLLTDVVMPGLSGPELARALKHTRPETAILYMSGFPGDVEGREGLDPDTAPLLRKPFTPAALSHKVRELLAPRNRQ
jgi:two-component system cell cycle sensor histidine kinase/response regulator CckA